MYKWRLVLGGAVIRTFTVALFPGIPQRAHVYCMTFDPHEESRGEFYHVSDVKGRGLTERGRAYSWCRDGSVQAKLIIQSLQK